MKFVDREAELNALERLWKKESPEFFVIYGKRRVGKTELIKQFMKNKPHIYFLAEKISEPENLKILGNLVGEHFDDSILVAKGFDSWSIAFEYLGKKIKQRTILVIDEFPYLAEVNKGISSIFQAGWDEYLKNTPIFLILCGSSIAMMENEVLAHKSPLFGRRTGQMLLKTFNFKQASMFFPNLSFEEVLPYYSILGGNPSYLNRIDQQKSWKENLIDQFLYPTSPLYNEVEFLLQEELREPRNYFAILKAIAFNKTKIGEIVNETGFEKSFLHKYIFVLEDLQIIEKEVPVTEKNPLKSRKGIYKLQDQFFKFWFKYILPNKSRIEEGKINYVLNLVKEDLNSLTAENYERVACEIINERENEIFIFDRVGRWWDKNEEIDLVALNESENKILFGEVKWSNKPVGINVYEDLKRRAKLVQWGTNNRKEYYCLFSKRGFTPDMIEKAKKEEVMLFHEDRLINQKK